MKLVVVLILSGLIIGGIIFIGSQNNKHTKQQNNTVNTVPVEIIDDKALVQKSTTEINNLVEIPNRDKAKVYQVNDKKEVEKKGEIFKKAYKGDLIILLPDKTIIFDPLTKTIRDISGKVYFDENF